MTAALGETAAPGPGSATLPGRAQREGAVQQAGNQSHTGWETPSRASQHMSDHRRATDQGTECHVQLVPLLLIQAHSRKTLSIYFRVAQAWVLSGVHKSSTPTTDTCYFECILANKGIKGNWLEVIYFSYLVFCLLFINDFLVSHTRLLSLSRLLGLWVS